MHIYVCILAGLHVYWRHIFCRRKHVDESKTWWWKNVPCCSYLLQYFIDSSRSIYIKKNWSYLPCLTHVKRIFGIDMGFQVTTWCGVVNNGSKWVFSGCMMEAETILTFSIIYMPKEVAWEERLTFDLSILLLIFKRMLRLRKGGQILHWSHFLAYPEQRLKDKK